MAVLPRHIEFAWKGRMGGVGQTHGTGHRYAYIVERCALNGI